MSVFVARFSKTEDKKLENYTDWDSILLYPDYRKEYYELGRSELLVFSFDSALDRKVYKNEDRAVFLQGYGNQFLERKFAEFIYSPKRSVQNFNESFLGILINKDGLFAYSSVTGVDQLFYLKTDNSILITNRINLLEPWLKYSYFNKNAFMWMAGRYHIGDDSTYYENLKRLEPANLLEATNEGYQIFDLTNTLTFPTINDHEVPDYLDSIISSFQENLTNVSFPKKLWLSGGKDSRAILGLLDAANMLDDSIINTFGEMFSPDVMAAKAVTNALGREDKHHITSNLVGNDNTDFSGRIAMDLYLDSMGCSLADIKGASRQPFLVIGGHENGFKVKSNKLELESFIYSRRYWVDAKNMLKAEAQKLLLMQYNKKLEKQLSYVPINRYQQADALFNRNSTYVGSAISISHFTTSEIHPFLDGLMMKLLLGISDDLLNAQFIHFYLCSKASGNIESVPFANDKWPNELLATLARLNIKQKSAWENPYVFNSAFPSQKGFGLYNWRLRLVDQSRDFLKNYISSHESFFDFLDKNTFEHLMNVDTIDMKIQDIYAVLAYLKIAFVHYFGSSALLHSNHQKIKSEIEIIFKKRVSMERRNSTQISKEEILEQKIHDYELAIVKLVEQSRTDESKVNNESMYADILSVLKMKYFNKEKSIEVSELLELLGFEKLSEKGIVISPSKKQLAEFQTIEINIELIGDTLQPKCVLLAIECNDYNELPNGFQMSNSGFLYKYVSDGGVNGKTTIEVNVKNKYLQAIYEEFTLRLRTWYNKKDVYYKITAINYK